ncbi:MAG: apolipoprotein N-acyltransferase [Ramlibacter sp.]|nr:apolipoprotein N-acyltransferase [Ramlibacter sp.]
MRLALRLPAFLLAALAGGAQALSLATPWNGQPLWWLQSASLAALVALLLRASSAWMAAGLGWVFGTAWLAGTFWWLFISMHTYGGLPAVLAGLAVLGLAGFLALYYAAACALFRALARTHWAHGALIFAACWTLAELARGTWFTGFPWGAGGYAQVDGPLAPWARYLGVYGVGAVAAWAAAVWAGGALANRAAALRAAACLAGVALAGLVLAQPVFVSRTGALGVTLLQGNIPQDEKFQTGSGIPLALTWYGQQLRDARTPLVVAPETAVPVLPQQLPGDYWPALQNRFASGQQAALLGVPLGSYEQGYTNSVVGFKPGASVYQFDKHHLVPFGEFIPPFFRWFTELMDIPLGDFNRGAVGQASFEWQGQRLAPNICYEDLFGEELGARFAEPANAPTVFVNVSNIGWFGDSVAIDQHLQISRMRALEFERPMIRATNTGATAIINAGGAVTQSLPRLTRAALVGEVEGRTGTTPYAWWVSRLGLWPLWLAALAVVLAAWRLGRRAR